MRYPAQPSEPLPPVPLSTTRRSRVFRPITRAIAIRPALPSGREPTSRSAVARRRQVRRCWCRSLTGAPEPSSRR
jgi:hypothetical protein